jgi:hypothetical protein
VSAYEECQRLLQEGKAGEARRWLEAREADLGGEPLFLLLKATTSETEQLDGYDAAIGALWGAGADRELLYALQRASKLSSQGGDRIRERGYLQEAAATAARLGLPDLHLSLKAAYTNRLLLDGLEEEAERELVSLLEEAIRQDAGLLVIAEGTLLCGLMMRRGRWREAASIAVAVEEAATARQNWIAFASGRMARAGCWHAEGRTDQAVSLLFATGNQLHARGAVAALNLVRARLTELRLQIGQERFESLIPKVT